MSRTLTAGMTGHLAERVHSRARMLRIDLADGEVLALTDHDRTIAFDLGDGEVDYLPHTGISASDLSLSTGFDADDVEVSGPVTETGLTTLPALLGGRFDDAVVRVFQVDWRSPANGAIRLLYGFLALPEVIGGRFKLTIHSEITKFQRNVGDVSSPYCRYTFGVDDGLLSFCPAVPATLAATVTAVTDDRGFTVSYSGTYANDHWNRGTVQFLTGDLAGTRPVEIFDFVSGGAGAGTIELFEGLVALPQVGDTLTIAQGCGHTRPDCVAILGDAVDFGGEPDMPGTDKMATYPTPGD